MKELVVGLLIVIPVSGIFITMVMYTPWIFCTVAVLCAAWAVGDAVLNG